MNALRPALLAMLLAVPAMAEPPKVDVRFVIEAQEFVDGLGSSRASVERALSVYLLERCREPQNFPFIRWVNNDPQAVNRLVVALVQRKAGAGYATLIEYRGTTAAGSPPAELQAVVYRWFEAKNADVPDVVRPRLEKVIHDQFADAAFRDKLLRSFVSRIPLAESVNLDKDSHRVLVPVAATSLLADEKSELSVSFFGKIDGRPGEMTLHQPQDYPQVGGVLCQIKKFDFAGVPPLTGDWSPRIPEVFTPAKVRDVRVTMATYAYKWYPDSTGQGRVRNP